GVAPAATLRADGGILTRPESAATGSLPASLAVPGRSHAAPDASLATGSASGCSRQSSDRVGNAVPGWADDISSENVEVADDCHGRLGGGVLRSWLGLSRVAGVVDAASSTAARAWSPCTGRGATRAGAGGTGAVALVGGGIPAAVGEAGAG
ncbi:MAG TPA: hypothetical protein VLQ80_12765, partial [Candidatus Saccharimonadia bacterium]|nr:hypothetical protein [Candidatus Saccharimonadia bacterium]